MHQKALNNPCLHYLLTNVAIFLLAVLDDTSASITFGYMPYIVNKTDHSVTALNVVPFRPDVLLQNLLITKARLTAIYTCHSLTSHNG